MFYIAKQGIFTFGICGLTENGFIGDPSAFFFFRVMIGGGVSTTDFCETFKWTWGVKYVMNNTVKKHLKHAYIKSTKTFI